jgi:hypothetical protein
MKGNTLCLQSDGHGKKKPTHHDDYGNELFTVFLLRPEMKSPINYENRFAVHSASRPADQEKRREIQCASQDGDHRRTARK